MALQASIEGHGVTLASGVLVADDLAAGRLVRPFDLSLPANFTYNLVTPETETAQPKVKAFIDWITAETTAPPEQ